MGKNINQLDGTNLREARSFLQWKTELETTARATDATYAIGQGMADLARRYFELEQRISDLETGRSKNRRGLFQ